MDLTREARVAELEKRRVALLAAIDGLQEHAAKLINEVSAIQREIQDIRRGAPT